MPARRRSWRALLDRTRRDSLAHRRLRPAYVTIDGAVSQRPESRDRGARSASRASCASRPRPSASGGTLAGRTVRFSFVLGDRQPLTRRIEVDGGGEPQPPARRPDPMPSSAGSRRRAARAQLERRGRAASASGRRAARAPDRHAHAARPRGPVPGLPLEPGRSSAATEPSTSTRPRPPSAHAPAALPSRARRPGATCCWSLLAVGGSVVARRRGARRLGAQLKERSANASESAGRGRAARRHRPHSATATCEGRTWRPLGPARARGAGRRRPGARAARRLRPAPARPRRLDAAGGLARRSTRRTPCAAGCSSRRAFTIDAHQELKDATLVLDRAGSRA